MQRRISVTEFKPITGITVEEAQLIRARLDQLAAELKPRRSFLASGSELRIRNLVGSVRVGRDLVLDVAPNVAPEVDWAGAIVDLLTPRMRIGYSGENHQAEHVPGRPLSDAFAELYYRQLDNALSKNGPLSVIRPHYSSKPSLAGRLDVTKWITKRALNPAHFPQHQFCLTVDNPFTELMAAVAQLLASSARSPRLASKLSAVAARLRPGLASHVAIDPSAALNELPPQWNAYRQAWATARAVIRRVAPLRRYGHLDGLNLALEPWPLLETLLERSLQATAGVAARYGDFNLCGFGHTGSYPLRTPIGSTTPGTAGFHVKGRVNPDGILKQGTRVIASFEAKYTAPDSKGLRDHAFQALTTAVALRSPAAVLVYPTNFEAVGWDLTGFSQYPKRLIAVGLDMYNYRAPKGDGIRAERLYRAVNLARTDTPVSPSFDS